MQPVNAIACSQVSFTWQHAVSPEKPGVVGKLRKTFSDVKDKMTAACNEIEFQFLVLRFAQLRDVDSRCWGNKPRASS
jgi:hypothetical protein